MDGSGVGDSDGAGVAGEEVGGAGAFGEGENHIGLLDDDALDVPLGGMDLYLRQFQKLRYLIRHGAEQIASSTLSRSMSLMLRAAEMRR